MSDGSWLPTTWKEARPQIIWGVLVLGFGLEFTVSILDEKFGRALVAALGVVGPTAMLIHGDELKRRLLGVNPNWTIAAFTLLLAAVIMSPLIEEKRWPLSAWFPSTPVLSAEDIAATIADKLTKGSAEGPRVSADEIAEAVVRKLPRATNPPIPATTPPAAPFVNPLHAPAKKWEIASRIRSSIKLGNFNPECTIEIVRYQEPYAEDYSADFKSIMDVAGLRYVERFADGTLDKELTLRMIAEQKPSNDCARSLATIISNQVVTRKGNSSSAMVGPVGLAASEAPDYLKNCQSGCVEADFGNEDPSQ
jgi:hypothetical protein